MFYTFKQKQSGGNFYGPLYVIIEADNANEANYIAENNPDTTIYFHGCSTGVDCRCCGDRWSETYEGCGTSSPEIYGNTDIESCTASVLVIRRGYVKHKNSSNEQHEKIINVLSDSSIVWTKYGSETIEELAEKILRALTN
jgi:hypothetical protein